MMKNGVRFRRFAHKHKEKIEFAGLMILFYALIVGGSIFAAYFVPLD